MDTIQVMARRIAPGPVRATRSSTRCAESSLPVAVSASATLSCRTSIGYSFTTSRTSGRKPSMRPWSMRSDCIWTMCQRRARSG